MKSSAEPIIVLDEKKPFSFSLSFGGRIVVLIVLLVLVSVLPLTNYLANGEKRRLYDEKIKSAKIVLEYLAVNAAIPLLGEDPLGLNVLVKETRHVDGFVVCHDFGRQGNHQGPHRFHSHRNAGQRIARHSADPWISPPPL